MGLRKQIGRDRRKARFLTPKVIRRPDGTVPPSIYDQLVSQPTSAEVEARYRKLGVNIKVPDPRKSIHYYIRGPIAPIRVGGQEVDVSRLQGLILPLPGQGVVGVRRTPRGVVRDNG